MHNDKSSDAGDGDGRNAAVQLVLAGIADRVAARLAPKTAAHLREAVEMGHGADVARWLVNEVVEELDRGIAHFTLPPGFQSASTCGRCGGVVEFGLDPSTPSSPMWERVPEQCVEIAPDGYGTCRWAGRVWGAGDATEDEEVRF
jgi:hypothetical protein